MTSSPQPSSLGERDVPKVVAVTGAAGYIGVLLLRRLLAEPAIERVVGIDVRPAPVTHSKLRWVQQQVTAPLDEAFAGAGVVVHLAFVLRQSRHRAESRRVNIEGAANVLRACAATHIKRIVVMSSSTVYGPHPDNPPLLTEEAPPRPPRDFHYAWDKRETEALFQRHAAGHSEAAVSVLRGCVVMGPSARNFITQALFKPLLVGVRGCDPGLQFVHEEDLAEVLWRFAAESHPGVFNVAAPGEVRWSALARMVGKRMVWLPAPLAYGLTDLAWRMRLQNDAPGVGLDFVRWPWAVSTEKLERELRFEFRHTSAEALASYLEPAHP